MAVLTKKSTLEGYFLWLLAVLMVCVFTAGVGLPVGQTNAPFSTAQHISTGNSSGVVVTADSILTQDPRPVFTELPLGWEKFCTKQDKFVSWSFTTLSSDDVKDMEEISCRLQQDQSLFLTDFRTWLNSKSSDVKHALRVECDVNSGGTFYVPWPMKVQNLVHLEINGCTLLDYYSEYFDISITQIPDQLRVLDIRHSYIKVPISELLFMIENVESTSLEVECGPQTLEKFVFSNISFDVSMNDYMYEDPSDITLEYNDDSEANVEEASESLWQKFRKLNYQCNFDHLRHQDESYFRSMSGRHLYSLQAKAFYPELRVYNLSHVGFDTVPIELQSWRFIMEKLDYLDLSHNDIHEIEFDEGVVENYGVGTINLQYNSIHHLRDIDLDTLIKLKSVTVDIRNNLINCSCGMLQDFRKFLKTPDLGRYEYLRDLKCGWPEAYRGRRVSDLSDAQAKCREVLYALTGILSCIVLVLCILVILLWRYRKQVVILAYTRLHIVLPCQTVEIIDTKDYDAFISYSSKDDDWVLKTLVQRLESQESGTAAFKLCVHHRDFEIGAAIADNVVRSVESSRHTVMVLSRNYVQSEWCIYEFRTAMHQSLIERRKHLILILLEDVPKSELDSDLRKCLETFTYIYAGETLFWDKLRYTLTVRSKRKSLREPGSSISEPSEKENLKSSSNNNIV